MENHKLKTLTAQYRNQKGEKKVVTNHEMHEFLERGLYRKDIAEELNISQARLRKLMETLNMWKMRVKLTNVDLVPESEPEPVKPPVVEEVSPVPVSKPKRPRVAKAIKVTPQYKKRLSKTEEIQETLQHELDQIRKVREEFALTVTSFRDKLRRASEILTPENVNLN
jgi:hypothetical protein